MLTDFQNFCTAGKHMKFTTKLTQHYPRHHRQLLHNLGKLKIQIFCTYSADIEENANILHFKKLPTFDIHLSTFCYVPLQIQTLTKILFSLLNTMLIVPKIAVACCDEFPPFSGAQMDRKSN